MYLPKTYSDEIYLEGITTVIGDIYYSNSSYDGKISRMRKLTEYIVRRLTLNSLSHVVTTHSLQHTYVP